MDQLKELCCGDCGANLVTKPTNFLSWACQKCCRLRCQNCRISHDSSICNCESRMKLYEVLNALLALSHCPAEELRLIEIPVYISSVCHCCEAEGDLYRYSFQDILCADCCPEAEFGWLTSSPLEELFLKQMDEFRSITKVSTTELRDTDLLSSICVLCPNCTEPCNLVAHTFKCGNCPYSVRVECVCPTVFGLALRQIPKNQLKLLNYSKWMNALSCFTCKVKYHEIYMKCLSVEEGIEGEEKEYPAKPLHTLFNQGWSTFNASKRKNTCRRGNGADVPDNTTDPRNYRDISTLSANYKKQIPKIIRCKCGREDDLKDMFSCRNCSEYGICGVCVARKHKMHETDDATNPTILSIVSNCAEKSLKKIMNWSDEYRQVNRESEEKCRKLCEILGSLFETAATSDDVESCEETLAKCDLTSIEYHIKVLLHTMKLANNEIDEFCTRLQNN